MFSMWEEELPKADKLIINRQVILDNIKIINLSRDLATRQIDFADALPQYTYDDVIRILKNIIKTADEEMQNDFEPCDIDLPATLNDTYFYGLRISTFRKWNPDYNQHAECVCGDSYYRHFDSYEKMRPIGCKYCQCRTFEPKIEENEK